LKDSLSQAFKEERLDEIARKTGFCKRKRKLTPKLFIEMLLCRTFTGSQQSLLDHVRELAVVRQLEMAKQSIDERFTPEAVEFLKLLVADNISNNLGESSGILQGFSNVFIQDSTRFKLPDHLKEDYGGYRVKGMNAGGALQFCFDLRKYCFTSVELTPATFNDSLKAVNNNWIEPDSLILRDLGYYKIEGLKEIVDRGAFFISKAKPRSNFYDKSGQKLNISRLCHDMEKKGLNSISLDLFVDRTERLPVRAVFCKVPPEVYQKRVREKGIKGKSRGWNMTDEFRVWCSLNIFITNIPKSMLTDKKLIDIYRLRWQIELVFKTWKSHYRIHHFKKTKKARTEIYIYATLLLIMIHWRVFSWLQRQWKTYNIHISLHKFSKYMMQIVSHFELSIIIGKGSTDNFIKRFLLIDKGLIEKENGTNKLCFSDIVSQNFPIFKKLKRKSPAFSIPFETIGH
jgi:hypothetical protein